MIKQCAIVVSTLALILIGCAGAPDSTSDGTEQSSAEAKPSTPAPAAEAKDEAVSTEAVHPDTTCPGTPCPVVNGRKLDCCLGVCMTLCE